LDTSLTSPDRRANDHFIDNEFSWNTEGPRAEELFHNNTTANCIKSLHTDYPCGLGFPNPLVFENNNPNSGSINVLNESNDPGNGNRRPEDSMLNDFHVTALGEDEPPLENRAATMRTFFIGILTRFGQGGTLTVAQLEAAMLRPNIDRNDAILLNSLWSSWEQISSLGNASNGDLTGGSIRELQRLLAAPDAALTTAEQQVVRQFRENVQSNREQITRWSTDLYASNDNNLASIIPEACIQPSGVGCCQLVSAIASLARANPAAIRNMIRTNNDGTYTVTFPNQNPITVNGPTDGELLSYRMGSEHGIWAVVLMKAYGKLRDPQNSNNIEAAHAASGMFEDSLRTLTGGSYSSCRNRLTRYSVLDRNLTAAFAEHRPVVTWIDQPWLTDVRPALIGLATTSAYGVRRGLRAAEATGEVIEANSGLNYNHAYSVLDYRRNPLHPDDLEEGIITVRNPHGAPAWRHGQAPEGVEDLDTGSFRMNLRTFNRLFTGIVCATQSAPPEQR